MGYLLSNGYIGNTNADSKNSRVTHKLISGTHDVKNCWCMQQNSSQEEPIDTQLDELEQILFTFGAKVGSSSDKIFVGKDNIDWAKQAIKEFFQTSEAEIRIDELKRLTMGFEINIKTGEQVSKERLVTTAKEVRERIAELESGTADTTGLASDKPSVRRATKFGKGK